MEAHSWSPCPHEKEFKEDKVQKPWEDEEIESDSCIVVYEQLGRNWLEQHANDVWMKNWMRIYKEREKSRRDESRPT